VGLAAGAAQRPACAELHQRAVGPDAPDQFDGRHDVLGCQIGDRACAEQRDQNVAQCVAYLRRVAVARLVRDRTGDFARDVVLDHRGEGRPLLAFLLAPLAFDFLCRIDAAGDQFEPCAGLGARSFERDLAIEAESAPGRMLAARIARDEHERLDVGWQQADGKTGHDRVVHVFGAGGGPCGFDGAISERGLLRFHRAAPWQRGGNRFRRYGMCRAVTTMCQLYGLY